MAILWNLPGDEVDVHEASSGTLGASGKYVGTEGEEASSDVASLREPELTRFTDEIPANGSGAANGASLSEDPREMIEALWWPHPPYVMETLISQLFAQQFDHDIVEWRKLECLNTKCTIELVVAVRDEAEPDDSFGWLGGREFLDAVRDQGVAEMSFARDVDQSGNFNSIRYELTRYGGAAAFSRKEYAVSDLLSLEEDTTVPCRSRNVGPQILGTYDGHELIQTCVCDYDCENDVWPSFSVAVPVGSTCQEIGGIEKSYVSETDYGLREVTVCSPSPLQEP